MAFVRCGVQMTHHIYLNGIICSSAAELRLHLLHINNNTLIPDKWFHASRHSSDVNIINDEIKNVNHEFRSLAENIIVFKGATGIKFRHAWTSIIFVFKHALSNKEKIIPFLYLWKALPSIMILKAFVMRHSGLIYCDIISCPTSPV